MAFPSTRSTSTSTRFRPWKRSAACLVLTGIALDDDSATKLNDLGAGERSGDEEVGLTLNVTFIHDEPDLRREVPAVPG